MEKIEWFGYQMLKKILKIYLFVLKEFTNLTDGRTDGWTPHDDIGRVYA